MSTIFYISPYKLTPKEFSKKYKIITAYLDCFFDLVEKIVTIKYLNVIQHKKGVGNAIFLIFYCLKTAKKMGIHTVELDDCSSNYRKDHNIYLKAGLKYIDDFGPEMIGSVKECIDILGCYLGSLSVSGEIFSFMK